jgi:50S ribosomal subunit-associated GTPase HflX
VGRSKALFISAKTGENIGALVEKISKAVEAQFVEAEVLVPMANAGAAQMFYEEGVVQKREDRPEGIHLKVRCLPRTFEKYKKLISEVKDKWKEK